MREGIAQIHLLHPSIGHLRLSRYPIGGPYNKDYSIWGSILGFPYFGKLPYWDNGKENGNYCLGFRV